MNRRRFLAASVALPLASRYKPEVPDTKPILIDSHVHVFEHNPAFPFAPGANPPNFDATAEQLLSLMQANGVSRTVIIQVIHYKWDNSYLASVLKQYPHTFHGVCRANPEDPYAPDHLTRLTQEQGFHGVRLSPSAAPHDDWIRGPLMPPLWRRCAQLRVPMTILAPVTRMPDLVPLIEQNPDLTVVIDHMADSPVDHPEQLNLLLTLARYPKVFVKISHMWSLSKQPYPYPDALAQIKRLHQHFTAHRLMWGTDWPVSLPYLQYAKAVALFRDYLDFLSPEDHKQILYKTVQQVWPFDIS